LKPVTKTTIVDQVIRTFMSAIRSGKWKPGEKIPGEIELSEILQVSRTSVREALRVLSYFKVIDSKPGFGTVLSEDALRLLNNTDLFFLLSEKKEMEELMEVRFFLEPQIAYWAVIRCTEKDVQEIEAILRGFDTMEDLKHIPVDRKLRISAQFHAKLAQICNNKLIMRILDTIQDEISRQRREWSYKWCSEPGVLDRSTLDHYRILQCMKEGKPEEAREIMFNHLLRGISVFQKNNDQESDNIDENVKDKEMNMHLPGMVQHG